MPASIHRGMSSPTNPSLSMAYTGQPASRISFPHRVHTGSRCSRTMAGEIIENPLKAMSSLRWISSGTNTGKVRSSTRATNVDQNPIICRRNGRSS